ncbi:MAG: hypothetical protein HY761_07540 [Candidatus Omnitrophica bacterium]|nr:hypothetical protein [Candidatus Omnitrophota bacterium]
MEKQAVAVSVLTDPNRFKKLPDGWIKDHLQGKDYGPSSEEILNEEGRKEFCAKLGGEEPTAAEAAAIINFEGDPCLFPIFSDTKTDDYYATKTEVAGVRGSVRGGEL